MVESSSLLTSRASKVAPEVRILYPPPYQYQRSVTVARQPPKLLVRVRILALVPIPVVLIYDSSYKDNVV